jgi:hypothetical protein
VAPTTIFSGNGSASTFCKPAAITAKGDGYEKRMMRITMKRRAWRARADGVQCKTPQTEELPSEGQFLSAQNRPNA